jgi:hypothetical protein
MGKFRVTEGVVFQGALVTPVLQACKTLVTLKPDSVTSL